MQLFQRKYLKKYSRWVLACLGIMALGYGIWDCIDPKSNIPKVIHYVWLGSEDLPPAVRQAVDTWEKYAPDYTIKRWDEHNCPIQSVPWAQEAYKYRRYDFASDWCRIYALQEGGIYMDTDMFLNAPFEPLLDAPLVLTLQEKNELSASFMAVIPNHPFVKSMKEDYLRRQGCDGTLAPTLWSFHFRLLFDVKKIEVSDIKEKYHIQPSNVLMYDFKGGENVAEHMFGNNSPAGQKSKWYKHYRQRFLDENAFDFPDKQQYFIPLTPDFGYFFDPTTGTASSIQSYHLSDDKSAFSLQGTEQFRCQKQTCLSDK